MKLSGEQRAWLQVAIMLVVAVAAMAVVGWLDTHDIHGKYIPNVPWSMPR